MKLISYLFIIYLIIINFQQKNNTVNKLNSYTHARSNSYTCEREMHGKVSCPEQTSILVHNTLLDLKFITNQLILS